MSELRDLYQELILDHNQRPRNFGALPTRNREVTGHNPLCGDEIHLALEVEGGAIRDVKFEGKGCAISKASASLMTQAIKGKSVADVEALEAAFHRLLTEEHETADEERLGKLAAFSGVREFPMRVKCATLCWHALKAALAGGEKAVSTE